jgi:hypothetical protein
MIYNLCKYIEDELTTEIVYRNVRNIIETNTQIADRIIIVTEVGGTITPWFGFAQQMVQIITRDIDAPKARELAYDVYNIIHNKFGKILPVDTVDSETFAEVTTAQMTAENLPQSIGANPNGLIEFSTNYKIIYRKD